MKSKNKPVLLLTGLIVLFSVLFQQFATAQSFPYTGEQLFAGIYFNDGIVVEKVPVLKKFGYKNYITDTKVLEAARRFQDDITHAVSQRYPSLFEDLKRDIASNDFTRIDGALERASRQVFEVMTDFMYAQTGEPRTTDEDEKLNQLKNFVNSYVPDFKPGDDTQELVAIVWVAVVAWEWVWVKEEFIFHKTASSSGGLKKEQLVAELVAL